MMSRPVFLAVTVLLVGAPAFAQDKAAEIDKIFSWATSSTPGCAVGVSHQGNVVASRAYGLADLERNVPISTNTIFDAGSVVKQFVSASVLLLVEEGRISLSEDVRKYIPELPDPGYKVTINHLLTHTSGTRDWTGFRPLTEGDVDVLVLALRQRGLDFAPGDEFVYSNSGFVLLKEVVARTSGMSFTAFTKKRLFDPLGMKSSNYVVDMTDVIPNRALAYEKEGGNWKQDMYLGNDRGGGGLMTTPSDLLIWNDALTNARLGAFVTEKIQEPATLNNGRKLGYARALFVEENPDGRIVWHSGGAAGYSTFLVRFPEQALSIAIMCNAGDASQASLSARRISEVFVPRTPPDATPPAGAVVLAAADLSGRAGLFFNERTGQPLRVAVNNSTLMIDGRPLIALATDRFRNQRPSLQVMSQAEFELRFLSADRLEITSKEGDATTYRRAQPYAPTAAELGAFAGRYESGEAGSVVELVPTTGGLVLRFFRDASRSLPFAPADRDTFMLSQMVMRFVRDKDGKVTGFDYGNPALRKVRFTRVADR